jgi:molecular chaperone DnaK
MKYYVGIDLGTTNSAICSYDGQNIRLWKSPEQNDVTPSAIYIDRRGNRYYGSRAYSQAPYNPENSAALFKRFMGTNTKIEFKAAGITLSPEECSAEILKVLFGYLPEEVRTSKDVATVVTVPAAFNQMKKRATYEAASLAGLGKVALMQEPVAAIMSVLKTSKQEGVFLVYDLGGGTFDISIAESIKGMVNLLAHGGIEMCGGRDFDRGIFNQLIVPWLKDNFNLPDDFIVNPQYKTLCRLAQWAAEQAKIELSSCQEGVIALSEVNVRTRDIEGNEIYLDIPLCRVDLDSIVSEIIEETVAVTRETMFKAGLTANDIEKIIFIGGATSYKPLRDKVAFELALRASNVINPMTAVAEGASIFAESIDWSSENHERKVGKAKIAVGLDISFKYAARTSQAQAKVVSVLNKEQMGFFVEFVSMDSGWSSGRVPLENNLSLDLPLSQKGDNMFNVFVYNSLGQEQKLENNRIVITRTMAMVGAIPASHSIGIEVLDKLGGNTFLTFLIKEGETLPKKGKVIVKAGQTLKAGTSDSLNIKLWEGDIQNPITDNCFIGMFTILGTDFAEGVIPVGTDIECEFTIFDSGRLKLEASVPCIGASFRPRDYFIHQKVPINLHNTEQIAEAGEAIIARLDSIAERVDDPGLEKAYQKAEKATHIDNYECHDPEEVQKVLQELDEAKKIIAQTRQKNLKIIRQIDLDGCVEYFNNFVRQYAKPSEQKAFDNLTTIAQRSIDRNDPDFDNQFSELKSRNTRILWRQDWYVVGLFNNMLEKSYNFYDQARFEQLKVIGMQKINDDQIDDLRVILFELFEILIDYNLGEDMLAYVNIVKG